MSCRFLPAHLLFHTDCAPARTHSVAAAPATPKCGDLLRTICQTCTAAAPSAEPAAQCGPRAAMTRPVLGLRHGVSDEMVCCAFILFGSIAQLA
jgi:hypothetical protein